VPFETGVALQEIARPDPRRQRRHAQLIFLDTRDILGVWVLGTQAMAGASVRR
jgi:hypothetical protein